MRRVGGARRGVGASPNDGGQEGNEETCIRKINTQRHDAEARQTQRARRTVNFNGDGDGALGVLCVFAE